MFPMSRIFVACVVDVRSAREAANIANQTMAMDSEAEAQLFESN